MALENNPVLFTINIIRFGGNPTELDGNQSKFYHSEKPPKKALQAIFNKLFRVMQFYG